MELFLHNVGIIKNSTVKLDGLTVITGKNSSGKTTVGKVLYALIRAASNIDKEFETSARTYLNTCLNSINTRLFPNSQIVSGQVPEECSECFSALIEAIYKSKYYALNVAEMLEMLDKIIYCIPQITKEDMHIYRSKFTRSLSSERQFFERFDHIKKESIQICLETKQVLGDPNTFLNFTKDRVHTLLLNEFHGQIQPVRNTRAISKISLSDGKIQLFDLLIKNKSDFVFSKDDLFSNSFLKIAFIDNPFIIDKLDTGVIYWGRSGYENMLSEKTLIRDTTIYTHDEHLLSLLLANKKHNYFDSVSMQNKLKSVFEKINEIVPGEFEQSPDGSYYVSDSGKLSIQNLATGSKMFFLIKMLLANGSIDKDTVLILDEPESHLHPEWINKFAEILVLLIKELKVTILLTTHSPNLLLALNVFAKKYEIGDRSHFYLANNEKETQASEIECIDDNINEAYTHLSLPFVEMSLLKDIEDGK